MTHSRMIAVPSSMYFCKRVPKLAEGGVQVLLRLDRAVEEVGHPHPPHRGLLVAAHRQLLQLDERRRPQPVDRRQVGLHLGQAGPAQPRAVRDAVRSSSAPTRPTKRRQQGLGQNRVGLRQRPPLGPVS